MLRPDVRVPIAETFRDDRAARQYLASAMEGGALLPEALLPPRKWMQAIYLTDGGRLNVSAERLAELLGISHNVAEDVGRHLWRVKETAALVAIVKKMESALIRMAAR